jgi:preprotein translocase subunit YajC
MPVMASRRSQHRPANGYNPPFVSPLAQRGLLMGFFIPDAYAQIGGGGGGPGMGDFVFLIAIFAVFWFLLIRPQQKRAKEHKTMVEALSKGDEAVTNGGLLGKITKVGDSFVTLEIADGLRVQVQRASIAQLMPKGTMKSI